MDPKVFKFGDAALEEAEEGLGYEHMYETLAEEDFQHYSQSNIIGLCQRALSLKPSPSRWQDLQTCNIVEGHDIVLAFEERIFDAIVEDLQTRDPTPEFKPLVIICLDTKDNPTEGQLAGLEALRLCRLIEVRAREERLNGEMGLELVDFVGEIVDEFGNKKFSESGIKVLFQICYL